MNATDTSLSGSEAAILERLVGPGFADLSREFAERVLALEFGRDDTERLHDLGAKARAGTLTPEEDEQLEAYLRVGHMLSIMKLKARQSLRGVAPSS